MTTKKTATSKPSTRGGARPGSGRKRQEFTPQEHALVMQMACRGYSKEELKHYLALIDPKFKSAKVKTEVFNREFADTYKQGKRLRLMQVENAMFESAIEDRHFQAQKYILENRDSQRWSNKDKLELLGDTKKEITVTFEMGEPPAWAKERAEQNRLDMEAAGISRDEDGNIVEE